MKSLLVLMTVVGAAMCQWGQPGLPQDTPEVAAAKAAHYAALARAGSPVPAAAHTWSVPAAPAVPQDTPEVAAAKAAHFAAVAQVQGRGQAQSWDQQSWAQPQSWAPQSQSWSSGHTPRWTGPVALPPGYDANGAPLPVQDTPEVAAERARHLSLYSSGGHPSLAPAAPQWNSAPQWNAAPSWNAQWSAPAASWNNQGLPQDTPEVAAAKAAHLAAHAQATHGRWKRGILAAPAVATVSAHSTSIVHSAAPVSVVHSAPLLRATPIVHSVPVLRAAHVVHSAPLLRATHVVHAAPIVHAAPLTLAHW